MGVPDVPTKVSTSDVGALAASATDAPNPNAQQPARSKMAVRTPLFYGMPVGRAYPNCDRELLGCYEASRPCRILMALTCSIGRARA
jgi:hypothetical protein